MNLFKSKIFKILPDSTLLTVAMLVAGFAEVFFLLLVMALDVLPFKYFALVIFLILLVDFCVVLLMTTKSKRGTRRIGGLVVILVLLNVLTFGDYYVYSTSDTLSKISEQRDTWEYYYVISLKEGSYQNINDVKGETINVVDMESKQLNEARERLVTKIHAEFNEVNGIITLGKTLVEESSKVSDNDIESGTGNLTEEQIAKAAEQQTTKAVANTDGPTLHDNVILVSNSGYKLMKANIKSFKKNTQVIYQMKVKKRSNDSSKAVDVTKDSFNILISGLDSWGTIDEGGLSDVNMVMTVNPTTKEILLTSIPRDSYITLHSYGAKDKLTHSGIYGEEETKATIEDFLGIDINYTIRVNFSLLQDIINEIGGIEIYSDYEFDSAISKFHYKKGYNLLAGKPALYFARERKAFIEGDMQRNKNQQIVLKAMIKKVTNSKVLVANYTGILNAVEDEMATDMSNKDLKKLAKMQLSDMKPWTVKKVSIVGATGGAPCFSMGGQNLSCVFPSDESVEKAKTKIHDVMYPAQIENTKTDKNNTTN